MDNNETIVWLAGRLEDRPRILTAADDDRAAFTVDIETGGSPLRVRVAAVGRDQLELLDHHRADRGSEVIIRGRLADGENEDVIADLLAIDPAHAAEAGS